MSLLWDSGMIIMCVQMIRVVLWLSLRKYVLLSKKFLQENLYFLKKKGRADTVKMV